MDALIENVRAQVMTQLRPMVVAVARRGAIDAKGLDRIETEARRLVENASSGALYLDRIERDEPASRGYLVLTLYRTTGGEESA